MNDKKRIILTVIGIVFILILLFGATYAYFGVAVTNDEGITNVGIDADEIGSIALTNPTPNLHISLSSKDMNLDNVGEYYATNDSNKYFDEEKIQREILGVNLIGGNTSDVYECNAILNINLEGTAVSALKAGDAYIQFGGLLRDKVDLTEMPQDGYSIKAYLVPEQSETRRITASIALVNKTGNQSYLAGKSLSVNITNSDFNCVLTEMGNNTVSSTNSSTLAISGNVGTELNNYKIYGNSIQNGTPSPTNTVELESVGDYDEESGKYVIPVTTRGKNLFDYKWFLQEGNEWHAPTSGSYSLSYVQLKPNTTYTISSYIPSGLEVKPVLFVAVFDDATDWNTGAANGHWASSEGTRKVTFTTDSTGLLILKRMLYYYLDDATMTNFFTNYGVQIQLEEGSTATEYESYIEPVTTNIYLNEPLRKVGDVSDYIDFASQTIFRNIGVKALVGDETWVNSFASGWTYTHFKDKKWGNNLISNYFETRNTSSINTNYVEGKGNNTAVAFKLDGSVATSIEEWTLWLESKNNSGEPLIVQYELATAAEIPFDVPKLSNFENATTIIEIGTSVTPSSIEANYLIEP